jgi:hypothetical protein
MLLEQEGDVYKLEDVGFWMLPRRSRLPKAQQERWHRVTGTTGIVSIKLKERLVTYADGSARRWLAGLAAVLGVLLLVSAIGALAASQWLTFTHPDLGFTLSYPDGWSVSNNPTGIVFMAIGPSSAGVPARKMNVNVTYEEVRANTPVDQYDAQNESGLGMLFHGYQRLRTDKTVIDAYPALIRYYTWTMGDGTELYQMQLVTIAGTHAYVVTGTTAKASTKLADELQLLVSILFTFRPH